MVSCPNCQAKNVSLLKSWPISFTKEGEDESKPQFYLGIFECHNCHTQFRSRLDSISDLNKAGVLLSPTSNLDDTISRLTAVKTGLSQTLRTLRERISTLENERTSLLQEASELRKDAETRANTLENEVNDLREELKSLRELLGSK